MDLPGIEAFLFLISGRQTPAIMTFLEFQRADQNSCQRQIRIIKGETGKESPEARLKGSETSRLIKTRRLTT